MKEAHINCVSLGIFSWARLEPEEGVYDFDWLEKIIQNLYENGIYTVLATPSGSKPIWMSEKYPEIRRVRGGRPPGPQRGPAQPLLHLPGVPGEGAADRHGPGPALCPAPRGDFVGTCPTSTRGSATAPSARRAFRRWLQEKLRHPGAAQPRLVERLLEPHGHRLGADPPPCLPGGGGRLRPGAGLEAVCHRPGGKLYQAGAGRGEGRGSLDPRHHQLHVLLRRVQLL